MTLTHVMSDVTRLGPRQLASAAESQPCGPPPLIQIETGNKQKLLQSELKWEKVVTQAEKVQSQYE